MSNLKCLGRRYGRLIVIHVISEKKYLCKCDCGTEKKIMKENLRVGRTKSCGCLNQEVRFSRRKDLTGMVFGQWTVIKFYGHRQEVARKRAVWSCKCTCGKDKLIAGDDLGSGKSTNCGCVRNKETSRRCRGIKRPEIRGSRNPKWRGGITPFRKLMRETTEYKEWRRKVFEKDNWTCQECGARNGNGETVYLEAHHIESFAEYPEKRFDVNNGKTLCHDCHKKERKAAQNARSHLE
jgi:5-methylcytosine-specific restriction endonuclease McrA